MPNPTTFVLDGVTTEYTGTFTLTNGDDLTITIDNAVVLSTEYSISGNGINSDSFTVTFTTAPTPIGGSMSFTRITDASRVTDFSQTSNWKASDMNAEFDNVIAMITDRDNTAMQHNAEDTTWDAESKRIINVADGTEATDAVTLQQLQAADNVNAIPSQSGHAGQPLVTDGTLYDWGTIDAGVVTFTPSVLADWDGSADPGDLDDALNQLAERVADVEVTPATPAPTYVVKALASDTNISHTAFTTHGSITIPSTGFWRIEVVYLVGHGNVTNGAYSAVFARLQAGTATATEKINSSTTSDTIEEKIQTDDATSTITASSSGSFVTLWDVTATGTINIQTAIAAGGVTSSDFDYRVLAVRLGDT